MNSLLPKREHGQSTFLILTTHYAADDNIDSSEPSRCVSNTFQTSKFQWNQYLTVFYRREIVFYVYMHHRPTYLGRLVVFVAFFLLLWFAEHGSLTNIMPGLFPGPWAVKLVNVNSTVEVTEENVVLFILENKEKRVKNTLLF